MKLVGCVVAKVPGMTYDIHWPACSSSNQAVASMQQQLWSERVACRGSSGNQTVAGATHHGSSIHGATDSSWQ